MFLYRCFVQEFFRVIKFKETQSIRKLPISLIKYHPEIGIGVNFSKKLYWVDLRVILKCSYMLIKLRFVGKFAWNLPNFFYFLFLHFSSGSYCRRRVPSSFSAHSNVRTILYCWFSQIIDPNRYSKKETYRFAKSSAEVHIIFSY